METTSYNCCVDTDTRLELATFVPVTALGRGCACFLIEDGSGGLDVALSRPDVADLVRRLNRWLDGED